MKAESQRCKRERFREEQGVEGARSSGLCLILLLHVRTHSAAPQQILTLARRNVWLLQLEALKHIIVMFVFVLRLLRVFFLLSLVSSI